MHAEIRLEYARALHEERLAVAARRRAPADGGSLERLVAHAAAGDQSSWDALVSRFTPRLERLARAQGLSRHEAQDAVQETWVRLLGSITHVREPRALAGWLATTARRESQRVHARARRETPTDETLGAEMADTTARDAEAAVGTVERSAAVTRALDGLPPRHRALLRALFAESEPSYTEIAAQLDIPVGSIGPIRGRALARLRRNAGLRQLAEAAE
jgi:RNA polymerase sigma factor (sigma-70 family)